MIKIAIMEHSGCYETTLAPVSRAHTSCELMYVIEGEIEITVNGKIHHITPNTLVLKKESAS